MTSAMTSAEHAFARRYSHLARDCGSPQQGGASGRGRHDIQNHAANENRAAGRFRIRLGKGGRGMQRESLPGVTFPIGRIAFEVSGTIW